MPDHQDYAGSKENLGVVYEALGRYDKAEKLYLEAKRIREKLFAKNHPINAYSAEMLGRLFGLQRAFKIAGAKYLIMSFWKVPDKQTQELMTLFYKNWLEKQMSIHESLIAAQKSMRNMGYSHYYWAGFVLVE